MRRGQGGHRLFPLAKGGEHPAADRIGEGTEGGVEPLMVNHKVNYYRVAPVSSSRPRALATYASTITLKPPYDMRLASNGIASMSAIILAIRGSFITFALTRSRCARDL